MLTLALALSAHAGDLSFGYVPSGATLQAAYLYWGGDHRGAGVEDDCAGGPPTYGSGLNTDEITFTAPGEPSALITAEAAYCEPGAGSYDLRVFRADVTAHISTIAGTYTVEDYAGPNGRTSGNSTDNASTALLLVYEVSSIAPRRVVLFDGLRVLIAGASETTTFTGLDVDSTPEATLTMWALEGDDCASCTDSVQVDGNGATNGPITLSDAYNDPTNIFNGTINTSTPAQTGLAGVDIDEFDISAGLDARDTSIDVT